MRTREIKREQERKQNERKGKRLLKKGASDRWIFPDSGGKGVLIRGDDPFARHASVHSAPPKLRERAILFVAGGTIALTLDYKTTLLTLTIKPIHHPFF